jgi:hypothetical protein
MGSLQQTARRDSVSFLPLHGRHSFFPTNLDQRNLAKLLLNVKVMRGNQTV